MLFAPTAVRLMFYMQCTLQAGANQNCDCNISSAPADQNAALPEKQKEILEQADVKYLTEDNNVNSYTGVCAGSTYTGYQSSNYNFTFINSIFHPPGIFLS